MNITSLFRSIVLIVLLMQHPAYSMTVMETELSGDSNLNCCGGTAVDSVAGIVYTSWIEADALMVGALAAGDILEVYEVQASVQDDLYHVMPSIALDDQGYIHLTADTHNQPWVYYISNLPYSLGGGFTSHASGSTRCPPGKSITYPYFFKDNFNKLYLSFRHYISNAPPSPSGAHAGNVAGGVAVYDTSTRTWTMLGGQNAVGFPSGAGDEDQTLFWNDIGSYGGWYQYPDLKVYFDETNRMHVSALLADTPSIRTWNGMTHLLYAYSDDGGQTFHRVDGSLVTTLPLTLSNASIVEDHSVNADIWGGYLKLGAFLPNEPVVSYIADGIKYSKKWDGSAWVTITPAGIGAGIYTRGFGEGVYFRPYFGLYRTVDSGATFEAIGHGLAYNAGSAKPDYNYYMTTGDFVWQAIENGTQDVLLYNISFSDEIELLEVAAFEQDLEEYDLTQSKYVDWAIFGYRTEAILRKPDGSIFEGLLIDANGRRKLNRGTPNRPYDSFRFLLERPLNQSAEGEVEVVIEDYGGKTPGIKLSDVGDRLRFSVAASEQPKRVTLWFSGRKSVSELNVFYDDNSDAAYGSVFTESDSSNGFYYYRTTIDFASGSLHEALTMELELVEKTKWFGSLTIHGVSVEDLE